MQPSADNTGTATSAHTEPPRSWIAVAQLLEQHGFGELLDDPPGEADGRDGDR
jgi:hypothetical protein